MWARTPIQNLQLLQTANHEILHHRHHLKEFRDRFKNAAPAFHYSHSSKCLRERRHPARDVHKPPTEFRRILQRFGSKMNLGI